MHPIVAAFVLLVLMVAVLAYLAWFGLRIMPRLHPPHAGQARDLGAEPFPPGLPAPVEEHFRRVLGDTVPREESVVVWGRGKLRLPGLWVPLRFNAWYRPGRAFRRSIELTWMGIPLVEGVDSYIDGQGRLELTGLVRRSAGGPKIDSAQHLTLWAEALWSPSVLLLDPRVRWEPISDTAAWLVVPSGDSERGLRVEFDACTGLLKSMSAMRFRGAEPRPTFWRTEVRNWHRLAGILVPTTAQATCGDEPRPCIVLEILGLAPNLPSDKSPF